MFKFLRLAYMGYDSATGTENSFTFIKSAEVAHGRKNISAMRVAQGGVPRGNLVEHKINWMKQQTYNNPTKTPGLSESIRNGTFETQSSVPSQTERLRDGYGVAQIPYSSHLQHGH